MEIERNKLYPVTINCMDPMGRTFTITITSIGVDGEINFKIEDYNETTVQDPDVPSIALFMVKAISAILMHMRLISTVDEKKSFEQEHHINGTGGDA